MAQILAKPSASRAALSCFERIGPQIKNSKSSGHVINSRKIGDQNFFSDSSTSGRGGRGRDGNKRSNRSSMLGQTEVFMQSGLKISELPLVVKKVHDVLQIDIATKKKSTDDPGACTIFVPNTETSKGVDDLETLSKASDESREIIAGLRRCFSVGGLFRLLETIPAEEVTPAVAVAALKLIINLDNHPFSTTIPFHRQSLRGTRKVASLASLTGKISNGDTRMSETFLRYAFINMLLEIIYRSKDPRAIIEGLEIVAKDPFLISDNSGNRPVDGSGSPESSQYQNNRDLSTSSENVQPLSSQAAPSYKEKLYTETIELMTEGVFSLSQLCKVVSILSRFQISEDPVGPTSKHHRLADKFWAGIMDKSDELNAETMATVFNTLPNLKSSRGIILKLLEERIGDYWQIYKTQDVLEILRVLTVIRMTCGEHDNQRIMPVISQWLSKNIHSLTENQLLAVVYCYSKIEFVDDTFVSTLERYIKARGCQIVEKDLVAAICDYSLEFRIRSKIILEGVGEYFIVHAQSLSTPQLHSITRIFGELDFHPPNGFKYWDILEHVLEHKFVEFPPKDIINLLLTFVYIERYPLNFVRKLFNPYFMDRLHNQQETDIFKSRATLKLFDVAMKQESIHYNGPYLPRDTNYKFMPMDLRLSRMANNLLDPMADIVGDIKRIGKSVVLSSLPLNPIYVVDMMIYPSVAASLLRFGFRSNNNKDITTIVIHPPEHYDRTGKNLIGHQAMRIRHLKKMGFRIMELKYSDLYKLKKEPRKLREHLSSKYYEALRNK